MSGINFVFGELQLSPDTNFTLLSQKEWDVGKAFIVRCCQSESYDVLTLSNGLIRCPELVVFVDWIKYFIQYKLSFFIIQPQTHHTLVGAIINIHAYKSNFSRSIDFIVVDITFCSPWRIRFEQLWFFSVCESHLKASRTQPGIEKLCVDAFQLVVFIQGIGVEEIGRWKLLLYGLET